MKQMKKLLCCILALCLILSAMPMTVSAAVTEDNKTPLVENDTNKDNETERDEPDATEPEATEPDTTDPEATEPEVTDPEATEPEATEPEATEPEATEPEATDPEATDPEATDPEATEPETTDPEATDPEATEPEATEPEETEPPEPDVIVSGTCGQEATWTLNETTGLMTISGSGIITNYSSENPAPWSKSADKITTLVVEKGITRLGSYAFADCVKLETVTLADTVLTTGSHVFAGCSALETVTLSKAMEDIAIQAFDGCTALKTITIPETVTTIGVGAFSGCSGLTEITVPASVTEIGGSAFSGCTGLTAVTLKAKLTTIAENTFYGCTGLTAIAIPEGVKTINVRAFYNCTVLAAVTLPTTLMTIGDSAFYHCSALTALSLPASLTGIGEAAFSGCTKLTTLSFPKKLASIGVEAFAGCTGLEQLDFAGNAPSIGTDAFSKVVATAYYPNGNTTWTESVLLNYGGTLTWQACCEGEHQMALIGKKDANCIEDGYTGDSACALCGIVTEKGEVIPALGHDLADGKPVHASGTKTHNYTCKRCSCNIPENCTYGDPKIIQEATMGQPGIKQYTCEVCGGTYTQEYTLESTIDRIYGANRYETSYDVADAMKQNLGISKFDTVIVASGASFPDALSGSYLACLKNAPILLTNEKNLNGLKSYINSNLKAGGKVYLLGGTSVLPKSLETDLDKAGYDVERLAGSNRYETNLAILAEAGVGTRDILVCTGKEFADSLSASSVNRPILLVNKTLSSSQKEFLESLNGNKIYIIGGESAVSKELETTLKTYGTVERIGGENRFETSVLVAHTFVRGPQGVVLAYSHKFPDGLCGGPLAYSMGAPLVLTANGKEYAAQEYVQRYDITNGLVLGGTGLISNETVELIFK